MRMKIVDNTPLGPAYGTRRKTGASSVQGGNFEQLLGASEAASAADASAVSDVTGIASMDGMLALQGVSDEEIRRRETVRQGHSMLDTLEALRASLLAGRVPAEVVMELGSRLSRQRAGISDPKLLEILDDIELRVAVEKAKLEKALAERGIVL